ncbi:MAG TPA: NfeD family protein [Candidatus Coprovivens excrementavium]|nr:NfeD family protein [Candidatus Coprovivens excrementavium]
MSIVWLVIIIALAIIEIATINLVTIWFVASGLISLILSYFDTSFYVQFAVFVIVGVILLLLTRKPLEKLLNKSKQKTNLDLIIDSEGIVTEEITKNNPGEVKVDGKRWTAVAKKTIPKGKTVKILKIEGVKLIVEEVK